MLRPLHGEERGGERTPTVRASVAVLEDEVELRERILVPELRASGFAAEGFATAADLYRRMLAMSFDLLVLDIGLPDADGFEVARYLRATLPIGIVTLSGRGGRGDRVRGLTESVDAWLTKPVDIAVLVATLQSLARRMRLAESGEGDADGSKGWRLSQGNWRLFAPDGCSIVLNLLERRLMMRLLASPGDLVTHAELTAELSEGGEDFDRHRLEILIHRLRRKVQARLGEQLPLRSVRGSGYLMLANDQRETG